MAADFTWKPGIQTQGDMEPRVLETQYGGGYRQSMADGVNTMLRKWSLQFNNRQWDEISAIDGFLKGKGGYQTFTWNPLEPLGDGTDTTNVKVRCKKWRIIWSTGGHATGLSAEFEEVGA